MPGLSGQPLTAPATRLYAVDVPECLIVPGHEHDVASVARPGRGILEMIVVIAGQGFGLAVRQRADIEASRRFKNDGPSIG